MSTSWSGQREDVKRLATEAGRAVEREKAFRGGLLQSGRRIATSGKIVVLAGLAGFLLLALWPRRGDADKDGAPQRDNTPGLLARAGMLVLALVRWRNIAGEAASLLGPVPAVPEASPARDG